VCGVAAVGGVVVAVFQDMLVHHNATTRVPLTLSHVAYHTHHNHTPLPPPQVHTPPPTAGITGTEGTPQRRGGFGVATQHTMLNCVQAEHVTGDIVRVLAEKSCTR